MAHSRYINSRYVNSRYSDSRYSDSHWDGSRRSFRHGAARFERGAWRTRDLALVIVRVIFIALLGMLIFSITASAAKAQSRSWQSLQSIRDAAEQYVRDAAPSYVSADLPRDGKVELIVTAADLDQRLQLADCGNALRAFTLNGAPIATRNTIAVRCTDENVGAWTLYVPVSVELERPVFILRHSLPRDAHVGTDDIDVKLRRVPGFGANYPNDFSALHDQHLKRAAPTGSVLNGDLLTRDLLVKRGQEVLLVYGGADDGVSVRASGLALADGGLADRVRVQNRSSLKVVEGTIESGNLVRVGL